MGGNIFTPKNDFAHGRFYSVNVPEMAEYTGAQPILIEQTFGTSLSKYWYTIVSLNPTSLDL